MLATRHWMDGRDAPR